MQLLEGLGHEVLTRHLVNDDAWQRDRLTSPRTCTGATWPGFSSARSDRRGFWFLFRPGFETGYVIRATAKKVILFYRRDLEKKISLLITGNTHPSRTLAPYSNLTDVESFITSNLSGEQGPPEPQLILKFANVRESPPAKAVHGGSE